MENFGFGRRNGQIIQMAYVVEDLRAAIDWWIADTGAGPWFVLDHFWAEGQVYRGARSLADITVAMSFSGDMNIELIQPLDDHPSVYREMIARKGYGFHHIGIASADVEADIARYQAKGYTLAYLAGVPTGGNVAYLEGPKGVCEFLELLPATPGFDAGFTRFWQAARDWDGRDPIRPFI